MQITSSQHLDAKKVLLRVPMEAKDFLETRALLLELLGRHQDALEYAPSLTRMSSPAIVPHDHSSMSCTSWSSSHEKFSILF